MNDKEAQFAFIHANSTTYPIQKLVEITEVSRSGYYKWLKRNAEKVLDTHDELLLPYITKIFQDHHGTYGRKRIKLALKEEYELVVNEKRISRIMRKYGLYCRIRRKRFRNHKQPHGTIPNILNRNFKAIKSGIKLAIDITYIEVKKGSKKWMYVCAIKDLFNGEIVCYSIGQSQDMELVFRALNQLKKKGFEKGAILHSDQGIQFTNPGYIKRLEKMEITQSMSRRGNCWDNACIENFFGHLKCEMYHFTQPQTAVEVIDAVADYINYYNHKRIQTKLKMSPVKYRLKSA